MASATITKGDCECCTKSINVDLASRNGMLMCVDCITREDAATIASVNTIVAESQKIDTTVEIKPDIFNATMMSGAEIRAAIEHDTNIAEDMKEYAMAQETLKRYKHLKSVMFELKTAHDALMLEKQAELRAWQTQVQTAASKLRSELKEQFKAFDVTYQPQVVKTKSVKSAATVNRGSSFSKDAKAAVLEAAKKYGVPSSSVQMVVKRRGVTADIAGQMLAGMIDTSK